MKTQTSEMPNRILIKVKYTHSTKSTQLGQPDWRNQSKQPYQIERANAVKRSLNYKLNIICLNNKIRLSEYTNPISLTVFRKKYF